MTFEILNIETEKKLNGISVIIASPVSVMVDTPLSFRLVIPNDRLSDKAFIKNMLESAYNGYTKTRNDIKVGDVI